MKPSKFIFIMFLSIFSLVFLVAQDQTTQTQANESVFAPFVSRIRVGVKDSNIVLLWDDSVDLKGICKIYRSMKEINAENLKDAKMIAEVAYGIQSYTDTEASNGDYYYCILMKDTSDKIYEVFIPFKNKTVNAVSAKVKVQEKIVSQITGISSAIKGDGIIIRFTSSISGKNIVLYRSTLPISESKNLLEASSAGVFKNINGEIIDYPVPGIDYYYALIDENSLIEGTIQIVKGQNSTTAPISIPLGAMQNGLGKSSAMNQHSIPLPYLSVTTSLSSGQTIYGDAFSPPTERTLKAETKKALEKLFIRYPEGEAREPAFVVLPQEFSNSGSGEAYTLRLIVNETILKANYEQGIIQLEKFLSLRRANDTQARSEYYLGICYAKTNDYKKAFWSFLLSESYCYTQARIWMDWVLLKLRVK